MGFRSFGAAERSESLFCWVAVCASSRDLWVRFSKVCSFFCGLPYVNPPPTVHTDDFLTRRSHRRNRRIRCPPFVGEIFAFCVPTAANQPASPRSSEPFKAAETRLAFCHSSWLRLRTFSIMEDLLEEGQQPPAKRTRRSLTAAQAAQRLEEARLRMARKRSLEREDEAASRREKVQQRTAERRSQETAEQAAARRERDQRRIAERRSQETIAQSDARRARDQERAADRRAGERVASLEVGDFGNRSDIDKRTWTNLGLCYNHTYGYANHRSLDLGRMTVLCKFCNALKWKGERPGLCCLNGKIAIPVLPEPPQPLKDLLSGQPENDAQHFLKSIRRYNSAFQMTSFGAKEQKLGGFMPTFKVLGQIYHQIGSVLPPDGEEPKFLQIYFMGDSEQESARRCTVIDDLRPNIVSNLQTMLHAHSPHVRETSKWLLSRVT